MLFIYALQYFLMLRVRSASNTETICESFICDSYKYNHWDIGRSWWCWGMLIILCAVWTLCWTKMTLWAFYRFKHLCHTINEVFPDEALRLCLLNYFSDLSPCILMTFNTHINSGIMYNIVHLVLCWEDIACACDSLNTCLMISYFAVCIVLPAIVQT